MPLKLEDLTRLRIIHIAGTKGKGSTCAFAESLLRANSTWTAGRALRTGLYTSPHLIHPEERVRLDSTPISQQQFADYFFEIYPKLPQLHTPINSAKSDVPTRGPRNLQLYFLLALHIFLREKVDVAIIETHSGGEYDATNFVPKPLVAAVTTLGMDHIAMLGPTIEDIAWHKAGIFKPQAVALSAEQDDPGAARVLESRARDATSMKLGFVGVDPRISSLAATGVEALRPDVQKKNASLAVAIVEEWLARSYPKAEKKRISEDDIKKGIEQCSWPGRFQILQRGPETWFLDAAHNEMSIDVAAQWFAEMSREYDKGTPAHETSPTRILIFSHVNELRDPVALLHALASALQIHNTPIDHLILTHARAHGTGDLEIDFAVLRRAWNDVQAQTEIWEEPRIERALAVAREAGKEREGRRHVLITGSQHLVGPVLQVLQDGDADKAA
ncbi:hypothetical protein LTR62_006823 [Meristemomyces frigidus]|uniref:tetrahydrofolate synthase n=1 Tax=Meristemomyces frigidus TaxID=1508187 RepID=A0AAN7TN44_9PEZI|nr:hypothetical protein LTR62_006823 [Meristemomyces frigidus]